MKTTFKFPSELLADDYFTATTKLTGSTKLVRKPEPSKPVNDHVPSANFKPSDITRLTAGAKVEHPIFGFGQVLAVDVQGSERKAKIQSISVGEKTLLLSFAKLMIVE